MSSASLTSVPIQWSSNEQQGQISDPRDIVIGSNRNVAQIAKVKDRLRRIDCRHLLLFRPEELPLKEGYARLEVGILLVERENDPGQLRSVLG